MVIKLQSFSSLVFLGEKKILLKILWKKNLFSLPVCISCTTNSEFRCQNIVSHLQGVYHRQQQILLPLLCFSFMFEENFISSLEQSSWNQWMFSLWARRSCFMLLYVQTQREELIMGFFFFLLIPDFSLPFLCPVLLQNFGFPWIDSFGKVTSDLVSKGSYLFIKMLSGQYSAGMESQAGFSWELLALYSIEWSWQRIYCNFEHLGRQHLSFPLKSNPDFNGIKGQNSPLDKNISPWRLSRVSTDCFFPVHLIFSLYFFFHSTTSNFSQNYGASMYFRRNPLIHN